MIETTDQHINKIEEQSEEIRRTEIVKDLEQFLLELEEFEGNNIYQGVIQRLSSKYQTLFNEAIREEDATRSKYALERMKGIAEAMNVLNDIKTEARDQIETLLGEE